MSRDALEQLLRSADAAAAPPPMSGGLADRVRRRAMQQRRARLAGGAVAAVAVCVIASALMMPSSRHRGAPLATNSPNETPSRDALAALEIDAAIHEQAALKLTEMRQRRSVQATASAASLPAPALAELRLQRDRAALILVYEADRATRDRQPERALAAYRRAIELFPTTYWAGVARQRLKEIPT